MGCFRGIYKQRLLRPIKWNPVTWNMLTMQPISCTTQYDCLERDTVLPLLRRSLAGNYLPVPKIYQYSP